MVALAVSCGGVSSLCWCSFLPDRELEEVAARQELEARNKRLEEEQQLLLKKKEEQKKKQEEEDRKKAWD